MLFGNLSKILFPVVCEPLLFFSKLIVFLHDFLNRSFESILIDMVVLVPGFNNRLVLDGVFDLNFCGKFILCRGTWLFVRLFAFLLWFSVLWEHGLEIDVKYILSQSRPFSGRSLGEVCAFSLGCEHFDVGVLLLDDFISGQHDERFPGHKFVENSNQ